MDGLAQHENAEETIINNNQPTKQWSHLLAKTGVFFCFNNRDRGKVNICMNMCVMTKTATCLDSETS